MSTDVGLYLGQELGRYGFPDHPFGPDRLEAFASEARRQGLDTRAGDASRTLDPLFGGGSPPRVRCLEAVSADREALVRFHSSNYIDRVVEMSRRGFGLLDMGDTPAFPGCYEAACLVVGTVLDAVDRIMAGELARAFVPIAGLHHARRDRAGGFCVFNDCGVAIAALLQQHGLERVAYVDIDAHHGDGVYYGFVDDPRLLVADIHEDGRYLFPGTGRADETGTGAARGTKLNIPLLPGATDDDFHQAWSRVEAFVEQGRPQFVLLQCGADSVAGDPITHLAFTPAAHRHATSALMRLAGRHSAGRLLVLGGGGYDHDNLARTWCGVVQAMLEPD